MSNFRVGQNLLFVAVQKLVLIILGKQVALVPCLHRHFPEKVLLSAERLLEFMKRDLLGGKQARSQIPSFTSPSTRPLKVPPLRAHAEVGRCTTAGEAGAPLHFIPIYAKYNSRHGRLFCRSSFSLRIHEGA